MKCSEAHYNIENCWSPIAYRSWDNKRLVYLNQEQWSSFISSTKCWAHSSMTFYPVLLRQLLHNNFWSLWATIYEGMREWGNNHRISSFKAWLVYLCYYALIGGCQANSPNNYISNGWFTWYVVAISIWSELYCVTKIYMYM